MVASFLVGAQASCCSYHTEGELRCAGAQQGIIAEVHLNSPVKCWWGVGNWTMVPTFEARSTYSGFDIYTRGLDLHGALERTRGTQEPGFWRPL